MATLASFSREIDFKKKILKFFGDIGDHKKSLLEELQEVESTQEGWVPSMEEPSRKIELVLELESHLI